MARDGSVQNPAPIPLKFDTTGQRRSTLGSLLFINAAFLALAATLAIDHELAAAGGFLALEGLAALLMLAAFRVSTGSRGTRYHDRVLIEPDTFLGLRL